MTIFGNGVDIVDNKRIKKLINNKNFINRIFNKSEIKESYKKKNKVNYYAKRFAAKEAFVKALGTGFSKGINFNNIIITNSLSGKPAIKLDFKLNKIIKKKYKNTKFNINLSLSDEKDYSIAYVIIEFIKWLQKKA